MTQLELFHKTMSHEPTGRYLFYLSFIHETQKNFFGRYGLPEDVSLMERFGVYSPVEIGLKPREEEPELDFSSFFKDIDIPPRAHINRIGVLEVPGSAFHFTQYISPLRNAVTLDDCRSFPFTDVYGWTDDHMAAEVEAAHAQGRVASAWAGHQYEDAWQIRGYEQFLMDMLAEPAIPTYILGRVHDHVLRRVIAAAKAGVDVIRTGDDVATQRALIMKPDVWRRFIKPLQQELYDVARAINPKVKFWYHSDGDITSILPELIDIGVDILNPVQPECMDLAWIKREYGKHIVFDGTIGTQTTMPFGTPEEVRRVIAENKKLYGYDGALIFSPTHVLEPDVPPENIMAFLEECAREVEA